MTENPTKTIKIVVKRATGERLYQVVSDAITRQQKATGRKVVVNDFCQVSGLSRTQLYAYKNGTVPGAEGILKITDGLRAWGYTVNVII